ncbi:MAG: DegT/DnrJ/EryC1/StrS family aminotransferase [Kiritimatiellae bacterium]|nr:DegT/DnrJ/EryC1/StrS family aminotransferase [Kiritimatiellia bacterium]
MKVSFYGHVRQYENIKGEIDANINEVLQSGSYVQGPMLKAFEAQAAEYFGTTYAVGVGNGTDALWLSLMALGIGEGDEVITNANTFFATAEAIWIAGAKAVLVDCDPKTKCIDPAKIEAAITPNTKAIMPVHLYGQCANMPAIWDIAEKHGLKVIEDNAQAIDGAGDTFKQGDRSDAVTTSFIIQKNLGCFGDGGMVFTNDAAMDKTIRKLRNHGSDARNVHSFGFNSRLDDLQAGVLSAKMKHITALTDQRIAWARVYDEAFKDCQSFIRPTNVPGYRHVYHLYAIEVKDAAKRDAMVQFLQDNGIDAKTHYSIAIHQQDGFPWGKPCEVVGSLENSEANAATCVSLPMYPELTQEEIDYVIGKVCEWDQANQ